MLLVLSPPIGLVATDLELDGDSDVLAVGDSLLTVRENIIIHGPGMP